MAMGVFAAELCWILYLRLRHDYGLRAELVGHHVIGITAASCALHYGLGQATCSVALITEVLPVSGALIAWGKWKKDEPLTRFGEASRVWVLKYWRIPIWSYFLVTLQYGWLNGSSSLLDFASSASPAQRAVAICRLVALVASVGLIVHDLYCLKLLKDARRLNAPALQPAVSNGISRFQGKGLSSGRL